MTTRTLSFWMLGLLAVVVGCSKDNEVDASKNTAGGIGTQCSGPDDPACGTNGVCALGYCRIGCLTDGECEQGALCIGDGPPYGCQLPQDIGCSEDNPCTMGLVCGLDGLCRTPCNLSTRCPRNEQQCIEGACYGIAEDGSSKWACEGSPTGAYGCNGATLRVCNVGALGWVSIDTCGSEPLCEAGKLTGTCVAAVCMADELRCAGLSLERCKVDLTGWDVEDSCATEAICAQSISTGSVNCDEPVCTYGERSCSGQDLRICSAARSGWDVLETCPYLCANTGCYGECFPTERRCDGLAPEECNANGVWQKQTPCPLGCAGAGVCGECSDGETRCSGSVLQSCTANSQWHDESCPTETPWCLEGACASGAGQEDPTTMVRVPSPQGGTFGIDPTEVTRAQYAKFLVDQAGDVSGQPAGCSWNVTFSPSDDWPPFDRPNHPVVYVDWCDAHAYCKWAGKRLCGRIGGGGNGLDDHADHTKSQWYAACSSGGQSVYPYGDTYESETCNGIDAGHGAPVEAASMVSCQPSEAAYVGIYDLSGNVGEWTDECGENTGTTNTCRPRGGAFRYDGEAHLRCDVNYGSAWSSDYDYIGFRCCSEP